MHTYTRNAFSVIKPIAMRSMHRQQYQTTPTKHSGQFMIAYIGFLAFMSHEPKYSGASVIGHYDK